MMIHLTYNSFFWLNTFTKITGDLKKNFDIASTFLKLLHISHLSVTHAISIEKEGMKVIFSWLSS